MQNANVGGGPATTGGRPDGTDHPIGPGTESDHTGEHGRGADHTDRNRGRPAVYRGSGGLHAYPDS